MELYNMNTIKHKINVQYSIPESDGKQNLFI